MQHELGELQREFQNQKNADRSFIVSFALLAWGVLCIGLGIKALVFSDHGGRWVDYFMIGGGVFFLWGSRWAYRLATGQRSTTIQLWEKGFLVLFGEETHAFAWNQIQRVEETIIQKGRHKNKQVLVIRDDEESFLIGEATVDEAAELRDALHQQTAVHDIPWQTHDENSQ